MAHDWGYRLFKMDGFWTGTRQPADLRQLTATWTTASATPCFSDPDKTNIEACRGGLKLVREAAGPERLPAGLLRPAEHAVLRRLFRPGRRDAQWGPTTAAANIVLRRTASRLWFLNGRVWWNDPDCVSVRAALPLEQARLNASFTAVAGDFFYDSDWLPDSPARAAGHPAAVHPLAQPGRPSG